MDYAQNRDVVEINPRWECLSILLADALMDPWCRICGYEVRKHAEATQGRHCCKLLHPLRDYCSVIVGFHTAIEDIETIHYEGGVEVG